jgi:hypothetical protein
MWALIKEIIDRSLIFIKEYGPFRPSPTTSRKGAAWMPAAAKKPQGSMIQ